MRQRVEAVAAQRADGERDVDLRRRADGDRAGHGRPPASVAASRAKSVTESCSPRVAGSMPAARSRASAAAGLPAQRASAARRLLRRVANAASTTAKVAAPVPRRRRPADQRDQPGVDVRLGPEHPPADGPGPAHLAVPGGLDRRHAVRRGARAAPPAARRPPPGPAPGRGRARAAAPAGAAARAPRRCTAGSPPARSAGGRAAPRTRSASASTTASRSARSGARSATVSGSRAASRGSISTAVTRAAAGSSPRVSEPRPGPTSRTTSSGRTPAVRTIRRIVLASCRKFCPSDLVGRRSSSLGQLADRGGPEQPVGGPLGVRRAASGAAAQSVGQVAAAAPLAGAAPGVQRLGAGGLLGRRGVDRVARAAHASARWTARTGRARSSRRG